MGRTIKRLSGLEIDEVSLVNRPANQHGVVAIAKALEDSMPIYDDEGYELDEGLLEHGDVVYDEEGTEFVFVEEEADDGEGEYVNDYEGELVGKAGNVGSGIGLGVMSRTSRGSRTAARLSGAGRGAAANAQTWGRNQAAGARSAVGAKRKQLENQYTGARSQFRAGRGHGGTAGAGERRSAQGRANFEAGPAGQSLAGRAGLAAGDFPGQATRHYGRNRGKYNIGGGSLIAAGAGGGVYSATNKSLGDQVMEGLSKALTNEDRDEVIAKAMDYMQGVAQRNEDLEDVVGQILAERETDGFVELAKSYELPADPEEIAGIMYRASQYLPQRDLETLDRMFSTVSDVTKDYYNEVGYAGGYESDTMGQIYAAAGDIVAKSGASMSQEQAVTAMFQANPAAYDAYEAEQSRR